MSRQVCIPARFNSGYVSALFTTFSNKSYNFENKKIGKVPEFRAVDYRQGYVIALTLDKHPPLLEYSLPEYICRRADLLHRVTNQV
jgi:hypothetical protein